MADATVAGLDLVVQQSPPAAASAAPAPARVKCDGKQKNGKACTGAGRFPRGEQTLCGMHVNALTKESARRAVAAITAKAAEEEAKVSPTPATDRYIEKAMARVKEQTEKQGAKAQAKAERKPKVISAKAAARAEAAAARVAVQAWQDARWAARGDAVNMSTGLGVA